MNALPRNEKFGAEHDQFSIEHNMKLIHSVAGKTLRILESVGIFYMECDDVVQLCLMTFSHAVEKFNRQSGNRFSTYYVSAMRNECLKIIDAQARAVKTTSLEEIASNEEDGDFSLYEIIPSEDATPSEILEIQEDAFELVETLSLKARMVLKCLIKPGLRLVQEFEERKNYAERAHEEGIRTSFPKQIDVKLIAKYYGFSRTETEKIKEELRKAVGDNSLWHYKK
jgi:RNA polymerase sigma factor (sigma-70 family)